MPETTTITVPPWAKGVGKYLLGLVPIVFGFWLTMHDMQRDFALEQKKHVKLESRVTVLEEDTRAKELAQTAVNTRFLSDVTYIRENLDALNSRLERLLSQ